MGNLTFQGQGLFSAWKRFEEVSGFKSDSTSCVKLYVWTCQGLSPNRGRYFVDTFTSYSNICLSSQDLLYHLEFFYDCTPLDLPSYGKLAMKVVG